MLYERKVLRRAGYAHMVEAQQSYMGNLRRVCSTEIPVLQAGTYHEHSSLLSQQTMAPVKLYCGCR